MFDTVNLPLAAGRWVPFVYDIDIVGIDLTGATFAAQVHETKDRTVGTPRASLTTQVTDVEGVRLVSVVTTDGVPTSSIRIRINEATMEAMNVATGRNAGRYDGNAFWDMHITPSGGTKFLAFEGTFTIKAGVTQ